jgi:hypothetical protein
MPENGRYDRNMKHVLTGPIKFVLFEGNTYVNFNPKIICHRMHN